MKIRKFEGANMREAIAKVKAELGDQAVIVATRQIRRGLLGTAIEISAAIEDDDGNEEALAGAGDGPVRRGFGALAHAAPPPSGPQPNANANATATEDELGSLRSELKSLRALIRAQSSDTRATTELRSEVASLRKLVEHLHGDASTTTSDEPTPAPQLQLAHAQPAQPRTITVPPRAQKPAPRAPQHALAHPDTPVQRNAFAAMGAREPAPAVAIPAVTAPAPRAKQPSNVRISTVPPLVAPSVGRRIMLVGPTGVGKTTTIAKLAARAALVEGKQVALYTLDNYRVGGIDQIRTFANLIGVPLTVLASPADLATIDDDADLALIDTAGRSPRDVDSIAELADALAAAQPIETHLVTAAGSSAAAIDALANRYRALRPQRMLVTKIDEAVEASELTRAPIRLGLPITWITTGQSVPEDLEEPTAQRLLELAATVARSAA